MKIAFVFLSRGIGGAERSMLRLMAQTHQISLDCRVILAGGVNPTMQLELAKLSIQCDVIPFYDLLGIRSFLREFKPDIAYLFGLIRTWGWGALARLMRVPAVIGAERSAAVRRVDRIGRFVDRVFLHAYIANSKRAVHNLHVNFGISADKLYVAHNGIPDVTVNPILHRPDYGCPTVICVANLTHNKGQHVLVSSINQLKIQYPDIKALLVGDDQTDGRFAADMAKLGLSDCYHTTGFVSNVQDYLPIADIFVLPTVGREGMPTSILEAMRASVPVVATNVGGVPELVENEQTGLLVPPNDVDELTNAIARILKDASLRRRLTATAAKYLDEHFSIETMVSRHLELFKKFLVESGNS